MTLPELCIRRPVMTTLLSVAMVLFGMIAYSLLPVAALPEVEYPTIVVSASLPGASAETMASSVATPIEKQLATIAGITSLTSNNSLGSSSITIQFDLSRSIDAAALDVQAALTVAARNLPKEMTTPPSFRKVNPADQPILMLALRSSTLPLSTIDNIAQNVLLPQMSTLSGISQISIYGSQKFAVRIEVDLKALTARNMTLTDIKNAVANTNPNTPVGTLTTDRQNITIKSNEQLGQAEDYNSLIVAWHNGSPVRLSEVATVTNSVENNQVASWFNGERSIVLAIQRQPGSNTVAVVDSIKKLLPRFQAQIPPSITIDVLIDRSQSIRDSLNDVQFTLLLAIALVVMVIFLFLKSLRSTLVPAMVLPISLIGTFAIIYQLGFSLNNLSLMAITLAVGFVVDDAIVMLENIIRHVESGMPVKEAALKGSGEISFTILSITISLVAAFIPVLFMAGIVGRLFHEFAVTISVAILVSGLVSLTLTPMMCSLLLKPHPEQEKKNILDKAFNGMLALYRWGLDRVLTHQFVTLIVTFATLGITIWLFVVSPKGFFPVEDTALLSVTTEASEDTSFTAMAERQKIIADILSKQPDVINVSSTVGASGPNAALNNGRLFITLVPRPKRTESIGSVIQRLRAAVAGVPGIAVYFQPVQNITVGGRSSKNLYQYTVQASSLDQLYHWVPIIQERLKKIPVLQDLTSDLSIKNPIANVVFDRERAAALGISSNDLREALYDAYGTRQISTIYTANDDYMVILEASSENQQKTDDISLLHIRTPSGGLVPLESLARITREVGPTSISHQGQSPAVTFSFNLRPGASLSDATTAVTAAEHELNLPATIQTGFQGTAQVFEDSMRGMGLLILAAIAVVYIVLGVLYESFIHPLTILSGLPSAALGALLTLLLFGMDVSVIAIIGVVLLIGIVKKNAIMMIDFALERRRNGIGPREAIYEACLLRFRPIMMTTLAAMMGALPIALGLGAGAELRQPLGLAVVGGLLLSQLLTLFITPVIYLYMERLADWTMHRRRKT